MKKEKKRKKRFCFVLRRFVTVPVLSSSYSKFELRTQFRIANRVSKTLYPNDNKFVEPSDFYSIWTNKKIIHGSPHLMVMLKNSHLPLPLLSPLH